MKISTNTARAANVFTDDHRVGDDVMQRTPVSAHSRHHKSERQRQDEAPCHDYRGGQHICDEEAESQNEERERIRYQMAKERARQIQRLAVAAPDAQSCGPFAERLPAQSS